MTKFNLKEAIAKNKATFFSSLNENKEYYRDAEADDAEHIDALEKDMKDDKKSSKMKKSELKAKIKEMVLAEMNLDIQDTTSEYDFLAEKKEDEEDTEIEDTEVEMDGIEDIDVDTTGEVNPDVKAVQDALTQAQAAAQRIGDEKLTDQIGNTITFFTRAHVVDRGAVAESGPIEERTNLGSELDEMLSVLEYDTAEEFFADNPGAVDELVTWILSVPEYRQKLKDLDTKDMNESMFPLFKRIM
jgi:hypothetical protein